MAKSKPRKKAPTKKKPGRKRPKSGRAKLMKELKRFKDQLRSWVNNTKVVWPDGNEWEDGSRYYFVVDQRLVDFVAKMIQSGKTVGDPESMEQALQERISAVNMAIEEKGGITDEEFREEMGDLLTEEELADSDGYAEASEEEEAEEGQEGATDADPAEEEAEEEKEEEGRDRRSAK